MVHSIGETSPAISPKSYGTAVILCALTGPVGIHHFYLGNWLHGLFDFGLLVGAIACFVIGDPSLVMLGVFLIILDSAHTLYVTYTLFVGKCKDGQGRLVVYPGQLS
jgi:hypothetical protein